MYAVLSNKTNNYRQINTVILWNYGITKSNSIFQSICLHHIIIFCVCSQDKSENLKLVGFVYYVSNVVSPEEIITEA